MTAPLATFHFWNALRLALPPFAAVAAMAMMANPANAAPNTAPGTDPGAIRVLLSADPESTVAATMSGTIVKLLAALGQTVGKGKLLVQMDCAEARARQGMAEAELAGAVETLQAKSALRKLDAVGDTELNLAKSAADRAASAVTLARTQVSHCSVEAPFSGRVAKVYVRPHESVNAGAPLVDLVSDGPIKLRLNIPSTMLRTVKVGTLFTISVTETGKSYGARVSAMNSRVDAVAQSIEIEGRLQAPAADLLPGMSGIAQFPPATAVMQAR
nr:efflux RND transporter periplasmic adaptor subunit [uncultured Cupriavidus sp.]